MRISDWSSDVCSSYLATFFPGNGMDKSTDPTDDSLFEFTFNVDYTTLESNANGETEMTCGEDGTQNCVDYALREEFDAKILASCAALDGKSSGIIYRSEERRVGKECVST